MRTGDLPDERALVPYEASRFDARRVLVLAPHPDDEVFGCGGALADLVSRGATIDVLLVTDGAAGASDDAGRRAIAARRAGESRAALTLLGGGTVHEGGLPDRSLAMRAEELERLVASWLAQDYEENLYMAPDALSVPDRDWFSRGGIASLEPSEVYTVIAYLQRDELPQALRTFYGNFAASFYPDVSCFTEWVPTLGIGGGPFFKTPDEAAWLTMLRMMLVRESGDSLYLNSGVPRAWFLPGRRIAVDHAATFFGEVSFHIESHSEKDLIEASVTMPQRNRPRQALLRVRHPEGKLMTRVELNGASWNHFEPSRERIALPPDARTITLRAYFK